MRRVGVYKHCTIDELDASAVLLPYEGSDLAMLIIKPNQSNHLGVDALQKLDIKIFNGLFEKLVLKKVHVQLPIFALDPNKISIRGTLEEMMDSKDLFKVNSADMTGISKKKGMCLSKIVHKAFILVDGKGTTESPVMRTIGEYKGPAIEFIADHPFAFMVVDSCRKLILMMGYFGNPERTIEVLHEKDLTQDEIFRVLNDIRNRN